MPEKAFIIAILKHYLMFLVPLVVVFGVTLFLEKSVTINVLKKEIKPLFPLIITAFITVCLLLSRIYLKTNTRDFFFVRNNARSVASQVIANEFSINE